MLDSGGGRRRLHQPGDGNPGLSNEGDENWRKQFELSCEYDLLRQGSDGCQASKKSPTHDNLTLPVPETDTGREVE